MADTSAAPAAETWPEKVDPAWSVTLTVGGDRFAYTGAVRFEPVVALIERWFGAIDTTHQAQAAIDLLIAKAAPGNAHLAAVVEATAGG